MNEEEEAGQKTRLSFEDLCRALNMDEEASNKAWRSYENISNNYTLEGSDLHWLACALFVACRMSVPTVGKGIAEGNYVSLTRILRSSEQSLIEFFNKMKKWQDMANLPKEFRQSTEKLERNFTVTAVIFKKYVPIFKDIFKPPSDEPPRTHRSRKQKRHPCTVPELFQFCWVLFVHAKGNFPMISDDLVNSYHLLLCAIDLVYSNSLLCSSRKDLLNPDFKGLSEEFNSKDYKPDTGPLCFIEQLCELHHGVVLDAKGVKEHFWKPFIKKLFERKILKGKEEMLIGFLDPVNFGDSLASINRAYEEHVLSSGALDERIFLSDGAKEEIGTPGPYLCERTQDRPSSILHKSFTASSVKVSTPLTGRTYLQDSPFGTPVSTAMEGIARLHSLLSGLKHRPSLRLRDMLKACARDPSEAIASRLKEMSEVFLQSYEAKGEENGGPARDIAVKYFCLAEALYYKTLESIIDQEKKRLGDSDLSCILEQDMFHRSLIACCLEIVIFSYHPPGEFQWVLQAFDIPPYHFYKVIEVLVRAEEGLIREVVKHLNHVEEQVLENLAWKESSPLWESIKEAKNCVPSCQEVMPPQYLENGSGNLHTPKKELSSTAAGSGKGLSTSSTTLHERYSSPPTGTARRRLFVDSEMTSNPPATTRISQPSLVSTIPAGQTVVTMATATVTANNGQTVTIPVQGIANENGGITFIPVQVSMTGQSGSGLQPLTAQALTGSLNAQQLPTTMPAGSAHTSPTASKQAKTSPQQGTLNRAQRTGSLCLFFRKVYHLASVRLRDLCVKLDISADLRRKIWTCFEYSLVHYTELMMDRHLDQLLMCAIYVMTKVTKEEKSFQNIMKSYRSQPQASSSVYRSVLISGRKRRQSGHIENNRQNSSPEGAPEQAAASGNSSPVSMRSSSTLPIPQHSSASSTPTRTPGTLPEEEEEEQERGDLICFYNRVYIKQIKQFALRYSPSLPKAGAETPPLCPYPSLRIGSPRRVLLSHNHSIYISPHKTDSPLTPRDKVFYYISSSPSNRLQEINSMLRTGETPTKKRSMAVEEEQQSPAKRLCQENHSAFFRRLQDVANDRNNSH